MLELKSKISVTLTPTQQAILFNATRRGTIQFMERHFQRPCQNASALSNALRTVEFALQRGYDDVNAQLYWDEEHEYTMEFTQDELRALQMFLLAEFGACMFNLSEFSDGESIYLGDGDVHIWNYRAKQLYNLVCEFGTLQHD